MRSEEQGRCEDCGETTDDAEQKFCGCCGGVMTWPVPMWARSIEAEVLAARDPERRLTADDVDRIECMAGVR